MADDKITKLEVVNMVVTTDLRKKLNLEVIASKLSNTEYNPEQFPGLVMRIKEPKTSALLFSSGKVVCTGAKSIAYAEKSIQKIIGFLKKVGVEVTVKPKLKVQNLVGAGELNFDLNLNKLAIKLRNTEYEPEQFPGLVYKIKTPFYASFLLFSNGKIVCTGTKKEEEMKKCLEQMIKNLKRVEKGLKRKKR